MKALTEKLIPLADSDSPFTNSVIDVSEAKFILTIMSEYSELQMYCQKLEDELIDIQTTVNNTSKRLS